MGGLYPSVSEMSNTQIERRQQVEFQVSCGESEASAFHYIKCPDVNTLYAMAVLSP